MVNKFLAGISGHCQHSLGPAQRQPRQVNHLEDSQVCHLIHQGGDMNTLTEAQDILLEKRQNTSSVIQEALHTLGYPGSLVRFLC